MNDLVKYLIESTIIISVFYLIYILIYNGDRGSKFNRLYLIVSSFLAISLPVLKIPVISAQKIEYTTSLHQAIQLPEIIISDQAPMITSQPHITVSNIIVILYLTGMLFFLSRFLIELYATFRYIRMYSKDAQRLDTYTIINTKGNLPTCSFYKYLFWDDTQAFNEKESNFIIKHEEGHILQNHTFDLIYLEILRIIFWFNPIVHGYKKAMLAVHEFLADEFALANSNKKGFVALLGRQILLKYNLTLSNHFSKSQTVKRIKMIKSGKKKPAVLRWTVMVTVVLTMFYFFSCEQGDTLNEMTLHGKDLPVLGSGWSYVSGESLAPEVSQKLIELKADHPSTEFYVAKGISGKVADFDFNEILEKYSFKTFYLSTEGEGMYVILGKIDKEALKMVVETPEEDFQEEIFTVVEDVPEPVGGLPAFYEYVGQNLKYPRKPERQASKARYLYNLLLQKMDPLQM